MNGTRIVKTKKDILQGDLAKVDKFREEKQAISQQIQSAIPKITADIFGKSGFFGTAIDPKTIRKLPTTRQYKSQDDTQLRPKQTFFKQGQAKYATFKDLNDSSPIGLSSFNLNNNG